MDARFQINLVCIGITLGAYGLSRFIARHYPSPFTTPVFFSTGLIICALLVLDIEFPEYEPARDALVFLLGPATVALAVPVYKNRAILRANLLSGGAGITAGAASTVLVALALSVAFELGTVVTNSLSVKSVTAPIAVELATIVRGNPTLAAIFVIVTGMIGAMFGPWLLNVARISHPLARGLALGTISHGQGTAQALSEGELQGAIAGIAMGLSAVLTAVALPGMLDILG